MISALFIGVAVATAAGGIGTGAKGGYNQYLATRINRDTEERLVEAANRLDYRRQLCKNALEYLGSEKIFILNNSMKKFVETFGQIKNVTLKDSIGLEELQKLKLDEVEFNKIAMMTNIATSLAEGVALGSVSGASTAIGAYGLAMKLATASTGKAIATLSGAAAKNATLAFFGGGSLSAGGMGVAGGSAVLGGLVAGPALLAMGLLVNSQTGKNLENAKAYAAQAEELIAEYEAGDDECTAIRRRTYMFYNLLARLDAMFYPQIYRLQDIIKNEGDDYSLYSFESKKSVAISAATAATIKAVLDTPILTEEGSLTNESGTLIEELFAKEGSLVGQKRLQAAED